MSEEEAKTQGPESAKSPKEQTSPERLAVTCPVVGIGASAGGLSAFRELLSHLPKSPGMGFVLIQHLAPGHSSQLTELLSKSTHMPVVTVTEGTQVLADHVYIIPPSTTLTIAGGNLHLAPRHSDQIHLPIDSFFVSLAEACQSRAIGVVLSGTGSDGSLGLAAIKEAGGITFSQDTESAEFSDMPKNAIAGGHVDFVLNVDQIARELAQIGQHRHLRPSVAPDEPELDRAYSAIIATLRAATGVDFGEYRDTTIKRRIARRMALHSKPTLAEYERLLHSNPEEVDALYRDMLLNVTSFFRDPDVFEALKVRVFPEITKGRTSETPVRIWVPGCATGEEAYSIAMVLMEYLDTQSTRPAVQIFGTDINDAAAIEKARPGIYPASIAGQVSPGRLARFFAKADGGYRILQTIRDMCVFARQNVATDPPFSRLDLISCRNLLIYVSPAVQQRIIPTFHYALRPNGFLLLGPSEAVGKYSDLFEPADRKHNIYSRLSNIASPYRHLMTTRKPSATPLDAAPEVAHSPAVVDIRKEADRIMLGRFAPAAVLVNKAYEILQFRGDTGPYLQHPSGQPTHNLLKMARESLYLELRNVIEEADKRNASSRRDNVVLRDDRGLRRISVEATPIQPPGVDQRCFLVVFLETPAGENGQDSSSAMQVASDSALSDENLQLRQELASAKEYLQTIIEQQSAANEELQSTIEESRSANEELQSTNEELQTAKEEMQSANEELRTVNDELQARIQEATQLGNDLANTLASIKLPIVMLAADLRIRRFTPAAATLLNLTQGDRGRPLTDIASAFEMPDWHKMVREVVESVVVKEREIQDRHGRWFLVSVYPYRTSDNRIDGVIVILRDVDRDNRRLRQALEAKDHFLAVLSHELRTPLAPVLVAVSMLQKSSRLDEEAREHLDVIRRNAEMEARLIDDLLDITRLSRGKLQIERRVIDLRPVVTQACDVCRPELETQHMTLTLDIENAPLVVDGDAARLQQVFWNLLKNAIKFTPHGGAVSITARRDRARQVLVEVADTGMGIDPGELKVLFRAFEQGQRGANRQFGGLGLGLSISRSIVELHGGNIEGRSEGKGKGATFTVRLPGVPADRLAAISDEQPPFSVKDAARQLRILLVEDHADTALIMARLLTSDGHAVEVAHDVQAATRRASEQQFDLLLSDLGLPDGSGLDLLRELRSRGNPLPAIALSGFGQDKDLQQSHEAGFAAHLTKPVTHSRLQEAIASVVGPATARSHHGEVENGT